jgi:hypothetical protein
MFVATGCDAFGTSAAESAVRLCERRPTPVVGHWGSGEEGGR